MTLGDLLEACRSPSKRIQAAARFGVSDAFLETLLSFVHPAVDSDLACQVVDVLEAAGVHVNTTK